MPDLACLGEQASAWTPLFALAAVLLLARLTVFDPRLRLTGGSVPGLVDVRSLVRNDRYRGVRVHAGPVDRTGGGGFLRGRGRGEIWLRSDLFGRSDIDALAILEHERGHAERDLPIPRYARRAIGALIVAGLGTALVRRDLASPATVVALTAYGLSALALLRDEVAASEYALRELWTRDLPSTIWRQALTRLGGALGIYIADAAIGAAALAAIASALVCR